MQSSQDGYGHFGKYDVWELVAEWNRESIPRILQQIEVGAWECHTDENDLRNLRLFYEGRQINCELRWLGIIMAGYDEYNSRLEYPITITSKKMPYEEVPYSKKDPNQGWEE